MTEQKQSEVVTLSKLDIVFPMCLLHNLASVRLLTRANTSHITLMFNHDYKWCRITYLLNSQIFGVQKGPLSVLLGRCSVV